MHFLHLIDSMNPKMGGVCQAVRTMIKGLSLHRVNNTVVSLDDPSSDFLAGEVLSLEPLGPAENPWSYSTKLRPWLANNIQRFDVVVVHGLWQFHSYAISKEISSLKKLKDSKTSNIPRYYIMPHGMLDPYFQKAPDRRLKAIRNIIYWKLFESKGIHHANGLLFTCEEERRLAKLTFKPYKPKNEFVIGLGVEEPPQFKKAMEVAFKEKCPALNDEPYLLFISRIHKKKGVEMLLNAYSGLKNVDTTLNKTNTLPHHVLKLVIAGPGIESTYGQEIEHQINEDPFLKENVILPGMLTGDSKWGAFYGCEAFVLPSHQENFGIAVVEALACSKPVLISDQVNIWREIEQGTGGLVGEDTSTGTRDTLKRFAQLSREEVETINHNARKVYQEFFTIECAAHKFLEVTKHDTV